MAQPFLGQPGAFHLELNESHNSGKVEEDVGQFFVDRRLLNQIDHTRQQRIAVQTRAHREEGVLDFV